MSETKKDIHPLASYEHGLPLGLYKIFWRGGGSSLAAIGMNSNGSRWIAPCNWVAPLTDASYELWDSIAETELIEEYH